MPRRHSPDFFFVPLVQVRISSAAQVEKLVTVPVEKMNRLAMSLESAGFVYHLASEVIGALRWSTFSMDSETAICRT